MAESPYAAIPARPPSVAEWEDLLVRLEIAPRALRVTLEEAASGDAEVRGLVARAVAREAVSQRLVESLRLGETLDPSERGDAVRQEGGTDTTSLLEAFTSLRMRTFAMAQRRGVDVWEWEADHPDGYRVSVYQLFTGMTVDDARLLASLRERVRAGRGAC